MQLWEIYFVYAIQNEIIFVSTEDMFMSNNVVLVYAEWCVR